MPACRQMSLTGTPASACLRVETIWVSVNLDDFMKPPGVRSSQKTPVLDTLPKGEAYAAISAIPWGVGWDTMWTRASPLPPAPFPSPHSWRGEGGERHPLSTFLGEGGEDCV